MQVSQLGLSFQGHMTIITRGHKWPDEANQSYLFPECHFCFRDVEVSQQNIRITFRDFSSELLGKASLFSGFAKLEA